MSRYPIPIMAKAPISVSDITLEDWLTEITRADSPKGVRLNFNSTRTVEPAFRVLARHADYLKGPLILNANILSGAYLNIRVMCYTLGDKPRNNAEYPKLLFFLSLVNANLFSTTIC